ncbi:hypothetical protein [Phaeobacter gallaeciensis]|uniref:hypothetical protein n=1 Tax=Phaeobacter gallaeciensis TaxID=60890 RepID=UPI00237EF346|nr:hypothetical protein [Phaeobacter gallaeciensis]MDE4099356.1 hypothetical protein [Phaeobacter gallaeciensis]MDE4108159.1 hypothetical protein [Phaeobacter gallaeciensis]MDE4112615.1 hypothetical protein [Phaeobacter gallaeciensis]MDE4117140.1 hypothetical protein [Phaeobacter gallaeciensis]MDE4121603.1 hypothetical protein [Phaeobacter gallaeciensis]
MNMNYSLVYPDLVYPDQSRLVGTESISPSQLDEVRYFVEIVEPIKFPLYQKTWPGVLYGTEGAYAFIRLSPPCLRIYVGVSWTDLRERVLKQKFQRRWADIVLLFELPGLGKKTLECLETGLMTFGQQWLPNAIWDNVKGMPRGETPVIWNPPLEVNLLAGKIFYHIWSRARYRHETSSRLELTATHQMGAPSERLYGRLHQQRGGWCYLLPGSRVSAHCPNLKAIKLNPYARKTFGKYYFNGTISAQPGCLTRPAGLVVGEAIQFRSPASAADFLFAGQRGDERWVNI